MSQKTNGYTSKAIKNTLTFILKLDILLKVTYETVPPDTKTAFLRSAETGLHALYLKKHINL